jgi:hypothetical protein
MNLSKVSRWLIRQALGSKRGDVVVAMLAGPIGSIIDMALSGRASDALSRLDEAFGALRDAIDIPSRGAE